MKLNKDNIRGWIGSITLHLVLALILFLWQVQTTSSEPEYIEVSWGSISNAPTMTSPRQGTAGSQGGAIASVLPSRRATDLPERTFAGPDDILTVPSARKLDVEDPASKNKLHIADNSKGQKDRNTGLGTGRKENFTTPGSSEFAGDVADPLASGVSGNDVGSSVSVSMVWSDGGTRKKLSGGLPEYPEGVNVEAQIKIEATVQPDGSVKGLRPAQKGNTKLEDAAMKEVRL
ncbi:MAG: hypothetical protein ACKVRP_05675, partial [Bacteroidota bacterium]